MKYLRLNGILVFLLLLIHAAILICSLKVKSVTDDERVYVLAGYHQWKTGDSQFNFFQPPLVKMWATWPLLYLEPELPREDIMVYRQKLDQSWDHVGSEWAIGHRFFYDYNNNPAKIIFWARLPMVLLSCLLGFIIYFWARQAYSVEGGVLALFIFVFHPWALSYGQYVMMDLGLAVFFVATLYFLWRYILTGRIWHVVLMGMSVGLALLSKFTGFFLFPIVFILCAIAFFQKKLEGRQVAYIGLSMIFLGWVMVGMGYKFNGVFQPGSFLLPQDYWDGLTYQFAQTQLEGSPNWEPPFLRGEFRPGGSWAYYAIGFLIRNPISFLIIVSGAVFFAFKKRRQDLIAYVLIIPTVFFFVYFSFFSRLQNGVRYLYPILPLLIVLCGSLTTESKIWNRKYRWGWGFWVFATLGVALISYPRYLSYFNVLVGGSSRGHHWMIDGDWGAGFGWYGGGTGSPKNPRGSLGIFWRRRAASTGYSGYPDRAIRSYFSPE